MSARRGVGVRIGPFGVLVRRRAVVWTAIVTITLLAVTVLAVLTGTLDLPASRVWAALTGRGSSVDHLVVVDRRLVRAVTAILVGFVLGLSGALTQSVTRNPIATPDLLGVTAGASAAAVLLITQPWLVTSVTGTASATLVAPAAVVGGLLTTAMIVALAWRGGFDGMRLILVGLGVNAIALAIVSWALMRADLHSAAVASRWLTGSLAGVRVEDVWMLLAVVAVATACSTVLSQDLSALRLGRDVAASLGTRTARSEAYAIALAVVAVSAATAVAGPIGFVAFVAPQAALRVFGTAGPTPLTSGMVGALVVLVADQTAQRLPVELPVGVLTAVIGAPALMFLLVRYVRRSSV
ncbi:iron ABC transporter permease [Mumia sp. zg.B21]|uniref:FecCD family ABC transporter permease n=2 Tax=unclassified Mumia TaxID=2621872 RepID=UPI001C6F2A90|nr:iron ABC transporter permease [Mumia sp. zg.B21]MBW9210370.1 iron ABC transporter permease [Mumia sp. zg.B21]